VLASTVRFPNTAECPYRPVTPEEFNETHVEAENEKF
jgi:hypothetical protein